MTLFALAFLLLSGQTASAHVAPAQPQAEVYVRPAVAAYEPPSDFGRQVAEGDAETRPRRAARAGDGAFDAATDARLDIDARYQNGVARQRRQAQALMGPLDGLWSVVDHEGRERVVLALTDAGSGRAIEGAWSRRSEAGGALSGSLTVAQTSPDGTLRLAFSPDGREGGLRLHPGADGGWTGELEGHRRPVPVRLQRRGGD